MPWSRCRSAKMAAASGPRTCSSSRFKPDPAPADDGDPPCSRERGLEAVTVLDATQVTDAVEVVTRHAQAPRGRAGGQQQLVVAQPSTGCGGYGPGGRVERGHSRTKTQFDRLIDIPRLRMHEDAVAISVALEVVLGEGRAFVRCVPLLAEKDDSAVETFVPQCLCCDGAGQAAAHDEEIWFCCHE